MDCGRAGRSQMGIWGGMPGRVSDCSAALAPRWSSCGPALAESRRIAWFMVYWNAAPTPSGFEAHGDFLPIASEVVRPRKAQNTRRVGKRDTRFCQYSRSNNREAVQYCQRALTGPMNKPYFRSAVGATNTGNPVFHRYSDLRRERRKRLRNHYLSRREEGE